MNKANKKKVLLLIILVIVIIILERRYNVVDYFLKGQLLIDIINIRKNNPRKAIVLYIIITIFSSSILVLPGVTFALVAGTVFGPFLGTFLCVISTSLGALISFILGRYFLKDSLKPTLIKNEAIRKVFFSGKRENDLYLLMLTRLVPIFPFNLQNYAYGLTDINIFTYFIFSTLFIIPGTAIYTFASNGLIDKENRLTYLIISSLLLVILTLVTRKLKGKMYK